MYVTLYIFFPPRFLSPSHFLPSSSNPLPFLPHFLFQLAFHSFFFPITLRSPHFPILVFTVIGHDVGTNFHLSDSPISLYSCTVRSHPVHLFFWVSPHSHPFLPHFIFPLCFHSLFTPLTLLSPHFPILMFTVKGHEVVTNVHLSVSSLSPSSCTLGSHAVQLKC